MARLSVDAARGIPGISALNILDSVDEVLRALRLPLAEVLGVTQVVVHDSSEILESFFDDYGFREGLFLPLIVNR